VIKIQFDDGSIEEISELQMEVNEAVWTSTLSFFIPAQFSIAVRPQPTSFRGIKTRSSPIEPLDYEMGFNGLQFAFGAYALVNITFVLLLVVTFFYLTIAC